MPLASRVRIWFSTSLMVLAMVVSSCSQPTRTCCGEKCTSDKRGGAYPGVFFFFTGLQRSPAYLHGVVGVLVVEDEGLLAELVVSLQLVDVGLVVDDVLLVLLQAVHLFLQGAGDVHGHVADLLQARERTSQ